MAQTTCKFAVNKCAFFKVAVFTHSQTLGEYGVRPRSLKTFFIFMKQHYIQKK